MTAPWIVPGAAYPAEPRWGHATGLQIGLAPLPGPRGLLRVFAPYLGHPRERLVNFIAIEPTPASADTRGFSELEHSTLDDAPGKRFWSTDTPPSGAPRPATEPARGVIDTVGGVARLTVYIAAERFDNGADVHVRVRFTANRPHEVALAAFANPDCVPLDRLTLTATMGNYARLRRLHLARRTVDPAALWPGFGGDGFTDHARFGLAELARDAHGAAVVTATPDEADPTTAVYAPDTAEHWKYSGRRAVQGWRAEHPADDLEVLVNGRHCYWASRSPIPGGTAYENFEFTQRFINGQEYVFTVTPMPQPPTTAPGSRSA